MRRGNTGLDDLLNEAQFTLRDDGGRCALLVLRILTALYRALQSCIRSALRLRWRSGALERETPQMPALADEPFNLSEAELEEAWRQQP